MIQTECLFDCEPVPHDCAPVAYTPKEDVPYTLRHGDCLEVLKGMEAETYTAIVTDPPAGIAFMGKQWDKDKGGRKQWIAWMAEVAAECLRVCKPGAHALVWALPRTSHWTATAWEDAGWEVRDRVAFAFGSGFPKSQAIGKALDKKAGAEREVVGVTRKGLMPGKSTYSGVDKKIVPADITVPATDDAKTWEGYGTALKPSVEDWWILRKPISEKSIAENCVKHGCGALNIDGSRVGTDTRINQRSNVGVYHGGGRDLENLKKWMDKRTPQNVSGRWPAHLVHDGSPEVLAEFGKAGVSKSTPFHKHAMADIRGGDLCNSIGKPYVPCDKQVNYSDEGSPARFFASCPAESGDYPPFLYGAKAGRKEKEKGLEGEETGTAGRGTSRKCLSCGKLIITSSDPCTCENRIEQSTQTTNGHPTVKSLSLMRWLCGLVKMPGYNKVLDCFAGTGTTLIAAGQLGMEADGIEQEEEYVRIGRLRLKAASS